MGWKPPVSRPIGKPGSEAFPRELVGLQGRQLAASWKAIRAQRAFEARMADLLQRGALGVSGVSPVHSVSKPPKAR